MMTLSLKPRPNMSAKSAINKCFKDGKVTVVCQMDTQMKCP